MHVPPIKGIAQVRFKVVDGTEPTLSMPMLVANGNRLVYRGEDTMLSTAAGEVVPLTSDGDDFVPEGADQQRERVHTDRCVGSMSTNARRVGFDACAQRAWKGEPRQRTITKTRKGYEVKNSSSPEQTGAAGDVWWADACETLVWPRGIRHLAVGSDRHCRCARCFWCAEFLLVTVSRWRGRGVAISIELESRWRSVRQFHLQKNWQRQEYLKTSETNNGQHSVWL